MLTWRALGAGLALVSLNFKLTTCQTPGDPGKTPPAADSEARSVDLPNVDTSSLTAREKGEWSTLVSELLAPCPDVPVSVAQCVNEGRDCRACAPSARFLLDQVKRGKTRSQVEAAFRTRFAPDQVRSIEIGDSPFKGAENAPIVIVEWADFECPFCGRAAPLLDELVKQYPGQVKLVFKHYPLAAHPNAEQAARAAVAAGMQSKFWPMHERLFKQGKALDTAALKRIAQELGLDMKKFADDLASERVADAVAADRKQANALSLQGTPMIYINGRHFNLEHFDLNEDLRKWLDLELELKGKAAPAGAKTGSAPAPAKVEPASAPAKEEPASPPARTTQAVKGQE